MTNNMLLFYKNVDYSVLTAGLTIPIQHQESVFSELGFTLERGQRKQIQILIDGSPYPAQIINIRYGGSKLAQLQSAGPLAATSKSVAAINPVTMMMAVALFSIEQQLGEITEMQKQILSFLEIEKESEIEADVETIFSIASKYKLNWDNEHFVASNHKMVLDIQRTARKNMLSYEKKVGDVVKGKKLIVAHAQVKSALQDLLKKFKYYRLSLYTFSMASLMEVMLGGNFKEEYVSGIKDEIRQMSETYRDLFGRCSVYRKS